VTILGVALRGRYEGDARASVSSKSVFVNRGIRRLACQLKAHRGNESAITAEAS
jgi:hypothetical protein